MQQHVLHQYEASNYSSHPQFNEYWPQQQPQHLRTSISGNSPSPHSSPSMASEEYEYNHATSQQQHHPYFNMYYQQQQQHGFQYPQQAVSPLTPRMGHHSPGTPSTVAGSGNNSDPVSSMSSWQHTTEM